MSAGETFEQRAARALHAVNGQLDAEPVELAEAPEPDPAASWAPVDLTSALDGTYQPPQPTVGERNDGVGLFYPGRLHVIAAEPEAAKTWFALMAGITEMNRGNNFVFLDFEDEVGATVDRLLSLGCTAQLIRDRFRYIHPEAALTHTGREHVAEAAEGATIAVLDGVTEAMSLHGLSPLDNDDIATFWRTLARWLARRGPAVVMLDHVTKNTDTRGRWAFGGQHKLAGLNGAQYSLDRVHPFGVGMKGLSRITVAKDRPGQIRRYTLPFGEGQQWFADLTLDGTGLGPLQAEIAAPLIRQDGGFRPTIVMRKISKALAELQDGTGLSKAAVEASVGGKNTVARLALELLVAEGYVAAKPGGPRGAIVHSLIRPFEEGS